MLSFSGQDWLYKMTHDVLDSSSRRLDSPKPYYGTKAEKDRPAAGLISWFLSNGGSHDLRAHIIDFRPPIATLRAVCRNDEFSGPMREPCLAVDGRIIL